jgi:hypothetical protein
MWKKYTNPLLVGLMLGLPFALEAQAAPIFLNNASFEDTPGHSKPPWGWFFCGPQLASPPDVHPSGMYGVEEQAKDGRTYVGMVVRDVNTWETIGQRLETPLQAGQCYAFSIWLALPQQYLSISRQTNLPTDYSQPAILRIWGGHLNCDKRELLAASNPIYHPDWKEYRFVFQPRDHYSVVILEAFYDPNRLNPYCGSLLLDHASALLPVDCESGELDFRVETLPAPPNDLKTTKAVIQEYGEKLILKPGARALEEHLYRTEEGRLERGNLYLHGIARSLQRFPEVSMIVRIPFHNAVQYKKCREYLAFEMERWKVADDQWKIKKRKAKGMSDRKLTVEFVFGK